MHWYVNFSDPVPEPGAEPTIFEWAGGLPALTRMTRLLHEKHIPADALLTPLFAELPPGQAAAEAAWLAEVFGGPAGTADPDTPSAPGAPFRPVGFPALADGQVMTAEQRARWVALATLAADEAKLPDDAQFRAAFQSFLEWSSRQPATEGNPAARWGWGPAGPPDTTPAAPPEADSGPVNLPGPDETVTFEAHIRPLFRASDRQSMSFVFDLWSGDDVRAHASGILDRLRDGTMPCDGAWESEKIDVFRRWAESPGQP
jgi:truncated hemoglobin YjbI